MNAINIEPRRWCKKLNNGNHDKKSLNILCDNCNCLPQRENETIYSTLSIQSSTRVPSQLNIAISQISDSFFSRAKIASTQSNTNLTIDSSNTTSRSQRTVSISSPLKIIFKYKPNLSSGDRLHDFINEYYRAISALKIQKKDRSLSHANINVFNARPSFPATVALSRSIDRGPNDVRLETYRFSINIHVYWYNSNGSDKYEKIYSKTKIL